MVKTDLVARRLRCRLQDRDLLRRAVLGERGLDRGAPTPLDMTHALKAIGLAGEH